MEVKFFLIATALCWAVAGIAFWIFLRLKKQNELLNEELKKSEDYLDKQFEMLCARKKAFIKELEKNKEIVPKFGDVTIGNVKLEAIIRANFSDFGRN
ncbi:MAG: hypothetical protein UIG59_02325 [Acutalibacteraceae bacterium]|nr:hypothetical protein [Acutalibacteraceae bacterium]